MQHQTTRFTSRLGIALVVLLTVCGPASAASWTTLNNPLPSGIYLDTCLLLTNGDVMCHQYASPNWHRLRPDNTGSYLNGNWDTPPIAPMPNGTDGSSFVIGGSTVTCAPTPCAYGPTYFASQVLPDGTVIVIGGEYNGVDGNNQDETNIGFQYDPATNSWSTQLTEPFGYGNVGDAPSAVLESGTMLLGNINSAALAVLNCGTTGGIFGCLSTPPAFVSLSVGTAKADSNGEEGYINLPNNKVLVVDANILNSGVSQSEIFDAATNTWEPPVPTAGVALTDLGGPVAGGACASHEVGPGVARPDGTIIYFSGSTLGQNAVYNVSSGLWSHPAHVDFPVLGGVQYGAADAPASLLPDGHVLVMSSPVTCTQTAVGPPAKFTIFNTPSHFFEWDGSSLTQVADSTNAGAFDSYQGRMLLLPTGEVLLTAYDQGSNVAQQLYRNSNPQLTGYGPVITNFPPANLGLGTTYSIGGTNFNGFSQGAFYGDDSQSSTNYPLVRITDSASHVFYAKTHGISHMGIEAPSDTATITTTDFDVPTGLATGSGSLVVVTNGFPSTSFPISVEPATTIVFASGVTSADYTDAVTVSATLTSGGTALTGKTVTFVLGNGGGAETCSAPTNGFGTASCSITPNQVPGLYVLTAAFAGDSSDGASSVSEPFTILKEDTAVAITGPVTSDYTDPVTVVAQLTDPTGGAAIPGKSLTFVLGSGAGTETCVTGPTDASGNASCSITPTQVPGGSYTLTATFAGDAFYLGSSKGVPFTITREETALAFTAASATTSDYHDAATVQAQLTTDGNPFPGNSLTFVLGSGVTTETCATGSTDASGKASCSITPNQAAGPYTLTATFAGNAYYLPSSVNVPFTITHEEDTLAFTASSPTVIANGHPATFSATLLEDGTTPPIPFGQTVTVTLGTGVTAQTCSGTTTATGLATCTIASVNQPLGPNIVGAKFAGDPYYLPSSTSEPVIDFAFLASGSMIIGNLDAATGTGVEFWGAQWSTLNTLSGGPAPNSFKGFADNSLQSCGGNWSTRPGNSSKPPATLPSYMGVIASTAAAQSGSTISGNGPIIVVVQTNPGYAPDPGHAGTGTVVATYCHP